MITETTYWIIILAIAIIINIAAYLVFKKKKSNTRYAGLPLSFVFVMICLYVFPNVYTIATCSKYDYKKLIIPQEYLGEKLSLGSHGYLFNNSMDTLTIETIVYGNNPDEAAAPQIILPGQKTALPFREIHYLFETPPASIRTKMKSERKRVLYCGVPHEEESE